MKTPSWWNRRSKITWLLQPLATIYEIGYLLHRAFTVQVRLPVPVICVGNITAGGSGKTPVALYIGERLRARGVNAFFVSRGYGGNQQKPLRVDPHKHRSVQVGDEPLLLAHILPTVVGKDRLSAAKFAISQGAQLLVFDDGFQHKKIYKDFSLLVVDGIVKFGNGLTLPAGPLRERFNLAIKRAHTLVVINPPLALPQIPEHVAVISARPEVVGLAQRLRGQRVVAFCGIAFPEKFRATLTSLGVRLVAFTAFADHARYYHETLLPLAKIAEQERAFLVTTRKDFVRLPHGFAEKVVIVDIALEFDQPELLDAQLDTVAGRT